MKKCENINSKLNAKNHLKGWVNNVKKINWLSELDTLDWNEAIYNKLNLVGKNVTIYISKKCATNLKKELALATSKIVW